ncbi:UNVERIFIED_CONTAM: hypothetical protein HDU68_000367, partial [Siphonaria sp. JEL0065]
MKEKAAFLPVLFALLLASPTLVTACKEPVVGGSAVYDPSSGAAIYFAGQICADENNLSAVQTSQYICSQPCNGLSIEYVKPSTGATSDTSYIPLATAFQCCALDVPSFTMHCMGGATQDPRSIIYRYDVKNKIWISPISVPNNLAQRVGHSCTVSNSVFYVFGGLTLSGANVDVPFFSYDVKAGTFNQHYLGAPSNRHGHQLIATAANQLLLLFGTTIPPAPSAQLQSYIFDTASSSWFTYQSASAAGVPQILDGAACTSWSSYLNPLGGVFCFGGETPSLQANPHLTYLNLTSNSWTDLGVPTGYTDKSFTPAGTFGATISVIDGGYAVVVKPGGANTGSGVSTYIDGNVACSPVDVNDGSGSFYGIPPFGPGTELAECYTKGTCSSTGVTGGVNGTNGVNKGLNIPVIPVGWTNPPSTGFPIVNGTSVPTSTAFLPTPTSTLSPIGGGGDDGTLTGWKLAIAIILPLLLLLCCGLLGWKFFAAKKNEKGTLPRNAPLRPGSGASSVTAFPFNRKTGTLYTQSPTPAGGAPVVELQDFVGPTLDTYTPSAPADSNIVNSPIVHGSDMGGLKNEATIIGGAAAVAAGVAVAISKKHHVVTHVTKTTVVEEEAIVENPEVVVVGGYAPTSTTSYGSETVVASANVPNAYFTAVTADTSVEKSEATKVAEKPSYFAGAAAVGAAVILGADAASSKKPKEASKTKETVVPTSTTSTQVKDENFQASPTSPSKKGLFSLFKKPTSPEVQEPVNSYDVPVEPALATKDVEGPNLDKSTNSNVSLLGAAAVMIPAAIVSDEVAKSRRHVKITKVVETETTETPIIDKAKDTPESHELIAVIPASSTSEPVASKDVDVEKSVEDSDVPILDTTTVLVPTAIVVEEVAAHGKPRKHVKITKVVETETSESVIPVVVEETTPVAGEGEQTVDSSIPSTSFTEKPAKKGFFSLFKKPTLSEAKESVNSSETSVVPVFDAKDVDVPVLDNLSEDNVSPVREAAILMPAAIVSEEVGRGKPRKHVKITKVIETEATEMPIIDKTKVDLEVDEPNVAFPSLYASEPIVQSEVVLERPGEDIAVASPAAATAIVADVVSFDGKPRQHVQITKVVQAETTESSIPVVTEAAPVEEEPVVATSILSTLSTEKPVKSSLSTKNVEVPSIAQPAENSVSPVAAVLVSAAIIASEVSTNAKPHKHVKITKVVETETTPPIEDFSVVKPVMASSSPETKPFDTADVETVVSDAKYFPIIEDAVEEVPVAGFGAETVAPGPKSRKQVKITKVVDQSGENVEPSSQDTVAVARKSAPVLKEVELLSPISLSPETLRRDSVPVYSAPKEKRASRVSVLASFFEKKEEESKPLNPIRPPTQRKSVFGSAVSSSPVIPVQEDAKESKIVVAEPILVKSAVVEPINVQQLQVSDSDVVNTPLEPAIGENVVTLHKPTFLETIIDKVEHAAEAVESSGAALVAGTIAAGAAVLAGTHKTEHPKTKESGEAKDVNVVSTALHTSIEQEGSSDNILKDAKDSSLAKEVSVLEPTSSHIDEVEILLASTEVPYVTPRKHVRLTRSRASLAGSASNISEPRGSTGELPALAELAERSFSSVDEPIVEEGEVEIKWLLTQIAANDDVIAVDLSDDPLTTEDICAIADALQVNTTMESLVLQRNDISPEGLKSLAGALRVNKSLKELVIGESVCGGKEVDEAFADALRHNNSLKTLTLKIEDATSLAVVADILAKNQAAASTVVPEPLLQEPTDIDRTLLHVAEPKA